MPPKDMDTIVSLCKRRGFVFPSSEIYGGLGAFWDYGPLGVEMKQNVRAAWWRGMVQERDDVVGLDSAILMHPQVWEASGHVAGFTDPLVECKDCHQRWRADAPSKTSPTNIVDIQGAFAELANVQAPFVVFPNQTNELFIRKIKIDGSNKTLKLVAASLLAGGVTNDRPLPKESIKKLDASESPLTLGQNLFPNIRHYAIGFPLPPRAALSAVVRLVFQRAGTFEAVKMAISFSQNKVGEPWSDPACPACGGELTEPRQFNLMFKTFVGPVEEEAAQVYLRPETAQGIFLNFQNVLSTIRKKLPLGIAQIGKAFRNEITPGNFIFRTREFEQMELEYFVLPGSDERWFQYWVEERFRWYLSLGIKPENLRLRPHSQEELAHYAKACTDIEYLFPMGWSELEGIANRQDFDLTQHAKHSGKPLDYYDEGTGQRVIPFVIEPSAGVDRSFLAFLIDAYDEDVVEGETRVVLRLHPAIAPIKVSVLPLSRRPTLAEKAQEVYAQLRKHFRCEYDDAQSIGRRYRRQDEIGTPYCVTVDFQSLEDHMVTIRERDSTDQIRLPIAELKKTLDAKLAGEPLLVLPPGGVIWKRGSGGD